MKALLAILGVTMGMVLAAPVHAEPGVDESAHQREQRALSSRPTEGRHRLRRPEPGRQRRAKPCARASTTACPVCT